MWREAKLAFSDAFAALDCAIVPAHPWLYGVGQQTDNGAYLSPANAVAYLAGKLASAPGVQDVVIMLVTGQTHDDFISRLDALTQVFPAPAFTQVSRLARSAAELATVRMQLPARGVSGLASALPLSVPTTRAVMNARAVASAQQQASTGIGMADMKAALAGFTARRASLLSDLADGLTQLTGKSARAWVFTASGDAATLTRDLLQNIPQPSAVHSAAIMLTGDNLDGIKGMIHEPDNNAGA
ncbi:hypothetical protein VBL11_21630 [Enterobacter cloacae]|uniref:hypothetical protein n=1 Tax=Enterobacter cloacae TaxID=550 RepID=UPI002B1DF87D|nr:hypothetical protein [Enterobacter cloacae]MEA3725903.1 hypothetical protein [Enterobacter cloacae]MEA3730818.1 hypothetical protein [Enterobacter cloacae]MEA3740142.1 hypothetical protein [Enterobacter cloacae]MEA3754033.1 hypothetical protein [Enterobacter cloacae]MEA3768109.1 hypothetical protein [Enterobacter cloacae]